MRKSKVHRLVELSTGSWFLSEIQFLPSALLKFEKHALPDTVNVFVGADLCTLH